MDDDPSMHDVPRPSEVMDAFWAITHGRIPLRYGRDVLYVSPEAERGFPYPEIRAAVRVDRRLRGVEMRLEWR